MSLREDFSAARSADMKLVYAYWEANRQKIRASTFMSAGLSSLAGFFLGLLVDSRGYWLMAGAVFVVLTYYFNNATFVVAERLSIDNPKPGEYGRYEYLRFTLKEMNVKFRSSTMFFVLSKILYLATVITTLVLLIVST